MWKAWIHEINTRLWSTFSSTWDISTKQYEKQKHGRRWVAKNKHRSSYPSKTESYCLTSSMQMIKFIVWLYSLSNYKKEVNFRHVCHKIIESMNYTQLIFHAFEK